MRRSSFPVPRPYRVDAVLLDFDGTLTEPGAIDFAAAREAMRCPGDRYTLEFIASLPDGERERAQAVLERFEEEGAARSVPAAGAEELVLHLKAQGLPVGLLTRNGRAAVERSLANFAHLDTGSFDVIITRDDPVAPKPAPDAIVHFAEQVAVAPENVLMVGDFILDVRAGRAADAVTAFLDVQDVSDLGDDELFAGPDADACDFVVERLDDIADIVRLGRPLPPGKLPNDLLARYLAAAAPAGPDVLVGAAVGEDVAALDVAGEEVVVVHGDPITLTSGGPGRYAVLVNANDIATSGAEPRWFLTTVLLPVDTTAGAAFHLIADLATECAAQGIALVGGHTEVTPVVAQPVVSGTMLGTVRRADLRDKRRVETADRLLLTKGLAVEGSALLATELAGRLAALGMSHAELAACRALLDRAGVVAEARIAAGFAGVHALHDVTEGGLATAVAELSEACGHVLTVRRECVPVLPETRRLCELLGADPFGLIGSGSLLVCCTPDDTPALLGALHNEGIEAVEVGEVGEEGEGVVATQEGRAASWPRFARDEAARHHGE